MCTSGGSENEVRRRVALRANCRAGAGRGHMLDQGEKVVHRIHGAGTVAAILQPDFAPKECKYYELDLVATDTRVLVPVDAAEDTLRPLSSLSTLEEALNTVPEPANRGVDRGNGWQRQQQRLQDRLGTGQMLAVAEVIRRLVMQRRRKQLSFSERRILQRAITFLASELALVKGIPLDQAERQVEGWAAV